MPWYSGMIASISSAEPVLDIHLACGRKPRDGVLVQELGHQDLGIFETFQLSSITRDAQPARHCSPCSQTRLSHGPA